MRFPEFSGEWIESKLGDIADFSKGAGISKDQRSEEGNPCILYGELYTRYKSEVITNVFSKTALPDSDLVKSKANDIIIPASGETAEDIATARCVPFDNILLGGDLNIIRLHEQDGKFFSYQLNGVRKYDIATVAQGVSVVHLHAGDLKGITVKYPSHIAEQEKISQILGLIDDRIATQSKIIEEQETLLRSLRHKIYSRVQAQSQCTIADVLCYEQPTKYLVTDTDYTDDDSQVPVLTANKAFILGYTTENFGIYDKGPCIILDDFTLDCKYVDFKFKVKSSAIKILRAKAKTNLRFIFEYFRFLELNTTEHRRHYIAEIEPMSILLPSNEEIDRIARLFTAIDERLEAARKELKILESQKMYMLQKMFI